MNLSEPQDPEITVELTPAENVLIASGNLDPANAATELHLPGGKVVRVPTALLLQRSADAFDSDLSFAGSGLGSSVDAGGGHVVVPIVEERLAVGKQTVVTGKVVLEKQVQVYEEQLDVPLAVRTFDIERVVRNQPVEAAPAVRQEGETTIYPIVEEQLVLTTQLVLKEELHVTRRDTERRDTRTVSLKRENIVVTRASAE